MPHNIGIYFSLGSLTFADTQLQSHFWLQTRYLAIRQSSLYVVVSGWLRAVEPNQGCSRQYFVVMSGDLSGFVPLDLEASP